MTYFSKLSTRIQFAEDKHLCGSDVLSLMDVDNMSPMDTLANCCCCSKKAKEENTIQLFKYISQVLCTMLITSLWF